jgi:hypothetical protein
MSSKHNFIKPSMNTISVGINVLLAKEEEIFVAYCPALELSSYGESENIAIKRFEEELKIFFEETSKKGTLEKYLLQNGWTLTQKPEPSYRPPEVINKPFRELINTFTENVAIPVY